MKKLSRDFKTREMRITLPENLLDKVDAMAGLVSRSAFIRSLIERAWSEHKRSKQ